MNRVALVFALLGAVFLAYGETVIGKGGHAIATIVTQEGATPAELHAAKDLQTILSKMVGAQIPLEMSQGPLPKNAILVGQGPIAQRLMPRLSWKTLGEEQTLLVTRGSTLIVAGGRTRGTLYAVNRLLSRFGVRFWTPWATKIPHQRNLVVKDLFVSESPAYEYRDPYWFHSFDADWATHNFDNGSNTRVDEAHGGRIEYQGFVHTYYSLVPPDKYFGPHPEWFSLFGGKRTTEDAQLCTTNPQLRDFVVDQVRAQLKSNPKARIISVSQNDCFRPCQCPVCRALSAREGSDSALVLDLVNYVAEKLEAEFPNVAFDTLAYQWSRKPPLTMRPRPSVIVRLCSIECNFSWPLDAPANKSFADDVCGWSRLTNRLYIWDYCTNFANYLAPQPDYFTFGKTFKFLHDHGAKGVFEEGAYQSNGSDMAELKAWVISQLLWNPKKDSDALVREFLNGYYGKAGESIYDYLKLVEGRAQQGPLSFAAPVSAKFLEYDTMHESELLWQYAEMVVSDKPVLLWRVKQAHLPVQFVWLSRWAEFQKASKAKSDKWLVNASREAFAKDWLKTATQPGPKGWLPVTYLDEGGLTIQQFVDKLGPDPVEPK